MTATEEEFKGHPILSIKTEDLFMPLSMGLHKCKAVVSHIVDIKKFVKKHGGKK